MAGFKASLCDHKASYVITCEIQLLHASSSDRRINSVCDNNVMTVTLSINRETAMLIVLCYLVRLTCCMLAVVIKVRNELEISEN